MVYLCDFTLFNWLFTRDDVVSQHHKSVALSFRFFLGSPKLPCFSKFPVSRARPEKLCDFYWLQLRITCKLGWIAETEKRYGVSKGGKSKPTA